jgi:hypothetical protein
MACAGGLSDAAERHRSGRVLCVPPTTPGGVVGGTQLDGSRRAPSGDQKGERERDWKSPSLSPFWSPTA